MGLVQNTAPPLAQREAGSRQAYSYKSKNKGSKFGGPIHFIYNNRPNNFIHYPMVSQIFPIEFMRLWKFHFHTFFDKWIQSKLL